MFVLKLAAVQRTWSPAALFNDQIQLGEIRDGGVARWWWLLLLSFSFKEKFKMLQFPTVQKMRLDLLCFIQPFLKNYLLSPVHIIIIVLYYYIYFVEAQGRSHSYAKFI